MENENPALLIQLIEGCTLGAITLILISGGIWGALLMGIFQARSCLAMP